MPKKTSAAPAKSRAVKVKKSKFKPFKKGRHNVTALVVVLALAVIGSTLLIASHASSALGPIVGIGSKCLDNYGNATTLGNKIDLYSCNGSNAQKWNFDKSTGQIINANNYCLDVHYDTTAVGTLVDLYQCNGSKAQVWAVNATAGTITSPQSGLCLDDQYANTSDGNQIWMYTCNGTNSQHWTVSTGSATSPKTVAPTITSAETASFTAGKAGSFTVTDSGTPTPTLNESGTLPTGLAFNTSNGVLSGTPTAAGTYTLTFTASNGVNPNAAKTVSVVVAKAPVAPTPPAPTPISSTGCSSPFTASYFCKTIANDAVLPNSSAMVSSFVSAYQNNYGAVAFSNSNYGIPIYRVSATQATSPVSFITADCGGHGSFPTMQVPIPAGATGAGGTDGSAIFYQASTGKDWEIWQFRSTGNGTYGGCAGALISNVATSNGVFPSSSSQLSASGISYLATDVTESDVKAGAINHAVPFAMPVCAAGPVAPARSSDCGGPGVVQEGSYFRFPSTLAMPSGLTPLGQMVFKAIQKYGMVDLDFAGSVGIGGEDASGWNLTGNSGDPITTAMNGEPNYQAIANLPWSQLQGIAPPSL